MAKDDLHTNRLHLFTGGQYEQYPIVDFDVHGPKPQHSTASCGLTEAEDPQALTIYGPGPSSAMGVIGLAIVFFMVAGMLFFEALGIWVFTSWLFS